MENTKKNLFINECDDVYKKESLNLSSNKKRNIEYWDLIDEESKVFLEKLALMAGVTIEEWGDEDAIKEIVTIATKLIEERFDVKFHFVNENY